MGKVVHGATAKVVMDGVEIGKEDRRKPFKVGEEHVYVPYVPGNISTCKASGRITNIVPPYVTVSIKYGRCSGKWTGRISEISRRPRSAKERRGRPKAETCKRSPGTGLPIGE